MIFQECSKNKGIVLVDIILALSLGAIFVVILFESSSVARKLFEQSHEREHLMDNYEVYADSFADMYPNEQRISNGITGIGKWYGNDRIETEIDIAGKISFNSVRSYPFAEITNRVPVCSVDFYKNGTISINQIFLPIDPLLPLSDLEVRNNIGYVSTDSTRASDPDIIILNIASSSSPNIISSINTGPGVTSLSLVDQRIFAAIPSTVSQIHLIEIDLFQNLSLDNKYTLPLPSTTTIPTTASSIFYYNNHVYVGTEKWDGDEFNILDISSTDNINKDGGLEIGSKITDIFIWDGIAYLATAAKDQLIVVDIRDSENPKILKTFSPSGWSRQEGKRILLFEENTIFGRTSGGFDIASDHELFSDAPTSSDQLDFSQSHNISGGVYGIIQDRFHTYIASRKVGHELQIFSRDIAMGPIESYSLPVSPQVLTCDNEKLYLLANSAPIIYEISFK